MKINETAPATVSHAKEADGKMRPKNFTIKYKSRKTNLLYTKNWLGYIAVTLFVAMIFFSCKKEHVADRPPIAHVNADTVIILPTDNILLDGSASSDPDGTITTYLWQKVSGPYSFSIPDPAAEKTVVKRLAFGVYQFELTVTDNQGLSARDTVMVTVDSIVVINHPPVANAGADQIIVLPADSIIIDASGSKDSDNNISTYLWTKISGPSSYTFNNANSERTAVTNLTEGVYLFKLKVTDAAGSSNNDTMKVTVMPDPTPCTACEIVFVSYRDDNANICICKADGSDIRRLTNYPDGVHEPAWSPDGTRIAFIRYRGNLGPALYVMNADGSNVIQRDFSRGWPTYLTWSPDGTKIACVMTSGDDDSYIAVVGATSGPSSLLFSAANWLGQIAWSPDGKKIAMTGLLTANNNYANVYTINADGTGFTGIPINDTSAHLEFMDPSWSPDGSKLAVVFSHGWATSDTAQIGVMNADGSRFRAIGSTGHNGSSTTSWSGDGARVAYTSYYRGGVSWVSADGSSSGTIVTNASDANWKH
jgi:Tol biopolymer transport system component